MPLFQFQCNALLKDVKFKAASTSVFSLYIHRECLPYYTALALRAARCSCQCSCAPFAAVHEGEWTICPLYARTKQDVTGLGVETILRNCGEVLEKFSVFLAQK